MQRPDPTALAQEFLRLNAEEFRRFWTIVLVSVHDEDSEIEARWRDFGATLGRPVAAIAALNAAVTGGAQ